MGGQRSEAGQWPWLCHIRIYVHGSAFIRCAATIIHRRWLTTAAHCFEYKLVVIEFLLPPAKLQKGNIFTLVSHSVHGGGAP